MDWMGCAIFQDRVSLSPVLCAERVTTGGVEGGERLYLWGKDSGTGLLLQSVWRGSIRHQSAVPYLTAPHHPLPHHAAACRTTPHHTTPSPTPLFPSISTHLRTAHTLYTQPSRLAVAVGRHPGHCLLVTAPSAHHTTPLPCSPVVPVAIPEDESREHDDGGHKQAEAPRTPVRSQGSPPSFPTIIGGSTAG